MSAEYMTAKIRKMKKPNRFSVHFQLVPQEIYILAKVANKYLAVQEVHIATFFLFIPAGALGGHLGNAVTEQGGN